MYIDDPSKVLDHLVHSDPFSYSDPDSVIALERALGQLSCVVSKAVASFDACGGMGV